MKMKSAGTGLVVLALGFGGGWLWRGMFLNHADLGRIDSALEQDHAREPPAVSDKRPANGMVVPDFPSAVGAQHRASVERLNTLTWGKQKGLPIGVNVFSNDALDAIFASVYDLSPSEINALNAAIRAAKEKLFAIAVQQAKVEPSGDGSRFVVEVPSTTDQGGTIYDGLLRTFADVLGPDRFQSFNELSGTNFESGFGAFGLANTRYELTVSDTTSPTGTPLYKVLVSSTLPGSQTTSTGLLSFDEVGTYYPLLGHFVPPGFQSHRGAN